jgi:hypothetical protein
MIRFACFGASFVALAGPVGRWRMWSRVQQHVGRGLCPRWMAARFAGSERVPSNVSTLSSLWPISPVESASDNVRPAVNPAPSGQQPSADLWLG